MLPCLACCIYTLPYSYKLYVDPLEDTSYTYIWIHQYLGSQLLPSSVAPKLWVNPKSLASEISELYLPLVQPSQTVPSASRLNLPYSLFLVHPQSKQLYHPVSQLCMEAQDKKIIMNNCQRPPSAAQKWTFQHHYTPNPHRIKG